ncbi:MAG: ROK family protein [Pirellulaceae bacterium]|nr:ROK family protein [Pirellulaceae bacterium]
MFLGIEIGGTKLQLAVGDAPGGALRDIRRLTVDPACGAEGILRQLEPAMLELVRAHGVQRIGIGFGGPVDGREGRVFKSHQIGGWDGFPLAMWCQQVTGRPAVLGNDCDVAALAEARHGAGSGYSIVLYVTVGTGIGGGLVIDGQPHGQRRPAVAEIGHLRPGVHCDDPEATVESVASGWGIVEAMRARMSGEITRPFGPLRTADPPLDARTVRRRLVAAEQADQQFVGDLRRRCDDDLDQLTAQIVAQAAADGNEVAREVLQHAWQTLGWAIAQAITLLAPDVVVVGGGVSLIGESGFFSPLRQQVERFVFPTLSNSYHLVPAALGELVVVHGAVALAAAAHR